MGRYGADLSFFWPFLGLQAQAAAAWSVISHKQDTSSTNKSRHSLLDTAHLLGYDDDPSPLYSLRVVWWSSSSSSKRRAYGARDPPSRGTFNDVIWGRHAMPPLTLIYLFIPRAG